MEATLTLPQNFQWADHVNGWVWMLYRRNGIARRYYGSVQAHKGLITARRYEDPSHREFETMGAAKRYVEDYAARREALSLPAERDMAVTPAARRT